MLWNPKKATLSGEFVLQLAALGVTLDLYEYGSIYINHISNFGKSKLFWDKTTEMLSAQEITLTMVCAYSRKIYISYLEITTVRTKNSSLHSSCHVSVASESTCGIYRHTIRSGIRFQN